MSEILIIAFAGIVIQFLLVHSVMEKIIVQLDRIEAKLDKEREGQ